MICKKASRRCWPPPGRPGLLESPAPAGLPRRRVPFAPPPSAAHPNRPRTPAEERPGQRGPPRCPGSGRPARFPRRRLDSYQRLLRENTYAASRTDARLRADREATKKEITRHLRATYQFRGRKQ
ncbi:hypothetical protein [Actinomadura sp. WMMB 499]|uniref:hypothetical protein n=1 Tax=Actinomadura sp. WMMB 499 TaxID=1219491 RepID=UPI00159DC8A5|nr:hypothetical protein [Actinomadura sp. WMMB 499]